MDRGFVAQLNNYRLTTAEILYWMPDHKHVLQSFVWQNLDLAPRFPALPPPPGRVAIGFTGTGLRSNNFLEGTGTLIF